MGIGPVPSVRALLDRAGMKLTDFDVIESNEAFASQALAVNRELGLDPAKVNPDGGAIALGHPVGATGVILTVKALYYLQRTGGRYGLDHHVHRRRPGHRAGRRAGVSFDRRSCLRSCVSRFLEIEHIANMLF